MKLRYFLNWKLEGKKDCGYDNDRAYLLKSEYINFMVKVNLRTDRLLLVTFQETINETIDSNCIKFETLWTESGKSYGIKVYTVEYEYYIFEKVREYTISFSEKIKGDINMPYGPKNSKPFVRTKIS